MEQRYRRVTGVAKYLGVSVTTIWNYAREGKLTPIKLSDHATVFDLNEIDEFVERCKAKVA